MEHRTETKVDSSTPDPMQPGDHHSSTQKTMGFLSEEIKPASTGLNKSLHSEGDLGLISEWGQSLGVGNSNPLRYSYLENPMDRGAWGPTANGVSKHLTGLSDWAHRNICALHSERWEHHPSISSQLLDHWWLLLYTTSRKLENPSFEKQNVHRGKNYRYWYYWESPIGKDGSPVNHSTLKPTHLGKICMYILVCSIMFNSLWPHRL